MNIIRNTHFIGNSIINIGSEFYYDDITDVKSFYLIQPFGCNNNKYMLLFNAQREGNNTPIGCVLYR